MWLKRNLRICWNIIFLIFVGVLRIEAFVGGFITLRNWTVIKGVGSESEIDLDRTESTNHVFDNQSGNEYGNYDMNYTLRFQPFQLNARKFLFKLPKPTFASTTTTTEEKEEETTSSTTTTTTTTTTTRAPVRPLITTSRPRPSTTKRPLYYFHPLLKKPILYGSPVQANLLQRNPIVPINSKPKGFLNLFEVIKFDNVKCAVTMGDIHPMEGVCYHEFECKSLGGVPTELCAEGVGVCCIFINGCGNTTHQPIVYFESPNYPKPLQEMMVCVFIVNLRDNVQQLRLDFIMFEINRPTDGDCIEDQFIVSGHNINFNVPTLCGINTGHHIYVHVGHSSENKIYLSFFTKVPNGERAFNIKITQLESDLAPDGCLQYFTEQTGIIKSFNYDVNGVLIQKKDPTYLNNLNYAVCIQRSKNFCSVSYSVEQITGEQYDFQILNKDEDENDLVPDQQAGAGIFNCPDDFIAINQVRLCGERFNDGTETDDYNMYAIVKDVAAGPIILPFRSDSEYVGRGFSLLYEQQPCI